MASTYSRICQLGTGGKSRSGCVILVLGAIVHWLSQKQSGTTLAVHEAELNSAVAGVQVGISIRNLTEELRERRPQA